MVHHKIVDDLKFTPHPYEDAVYRDGSFVPIPDLGLTDNGWEGHEFRLVLESFQNTTYLQVLLENVNLGDAEVYAHDSSGSSSHGPYSQKHVSKIGTMVIPPVVGNTVVVTVRKKTLVPHLDIRGVVRGFPYQMVQELNKNNHFQSIMAEHGSHRKLSETQIQWEASPSADDACFQNAHCVPEYQKLWNATTMIRLSGGFFCSSTVIAGPDNSVFVVTAHHCGADPYDTLICFGHQLPCDEYNPIAGVIPLGKQTATLHCSNNVERVSTDYYTDTTILQLKVHPFDHPRVVDDLSLQAWSADTPNALMFTRPGIGLSNPAMNPLVIVNYFDGPAVFEGNTKAEAGEYLIEADGSTGV